MTILTTHVGSLPRGNDLAQLLIKQDHGEAVDDALFETTVQAAIDHAVQKQAEAGVGIMSDGEMGKVGYATYITARLEGFGGHVDRTPAKDLADLPELRIHDARLLAGAESLYTPRLQRASGEIAPLDDEASGDEQEDALRRVHAAMRDSLTVARANRFVEALLPERKSSMSSADIPLRCDDDIADLIACLLHARTADARYRVDVPEDVAPHFDAKLSHRLERFTLSRK